MLVACLSSSGLQSAMRYEKLQGADSGPVLGDAKTGKLKYIDIMAARLNSWCKIAKLVISPTTIPSRFAYVHECLPPLLVQVADVAAINLYMLQSCKRFGYAKSDLLRLPKGVNFGGVYEDLGLAIEILPACREYQGQNVCILRCDDDKIYDQDWAQRYLDVSKEHPDSVICE